MNLERVIIFGLTLAATCGLAIYGHYFLALVVVIIGTALAEEAK